VHAFRRDELMEFTLTPGTAPADVCELRLDDEAPADILSRRQAWLAGHA